MARFVKVGDKAPEFCLPDQNNRIICLKDFKGKWFVLYFYPKDNTSGCTQEAVDFSEYLKDFKRMDAAIIGVSPDSTKSHISFVNKHNLRITVLSDTEHNVLQKYGVWQKKKMYGREYYGVVRTTFLIDPKGKIVHKWEKVKVKGHVSDVKAALAKTCQSRQGSFLLKKRR